MRVMGIAGWSGAGKTTLLGRLIPELVAGGTSVSTIKHAHHGFDIDQPGKDSYLHRIAGASEVLVASGRRWALMHELRAVPEPSLGDLLARLSPVDLVLVEGYKATVPVKLEVYRPSAGRPPLHPGDPAIVGVASDEALPGLAIPVLALDDIAAIAAFCWSEAWPLARIQAEAGP